VHLNLAIALFMGYMIFAVGVELAKDNEVKVGLHLFLSQHAPFTHAVVAFDHFMKRGCGWEYYVNMKVDLQRQKLYFCL